MPDGQIDLPCYRRKLLAVGVAVSCRALRDRLLAQLLPPLMLAACASTVSVPPTPQTSPPAVPAALTGASFAVQLASALQLPAPAKTIQYADVHPGDPAYAAIQAISPYLNRQVLCPNCMLNANFGSDVPPTRGATAVTLATWLIEQGKLPLLSQAEADQELASVRDARSLPPVTRRYLATALRAGLLTLRDGGQLQANAPVTAAEFKSGLTRAQVLAQPASRQQ